MRAVQDVDQAGDRNRSEHGHREAERVTVAGIELLNEIDLHPGASIKTNFQNDRLASERVDMSWLNVTKASCPCVCVGVAGFGAKEAIFIAPRFDRSGAVYLPAPVAVRTVIEQNFVLSRIVVQPWFFACEFCQRLGYLVLGVGVQKVGPR